VRRRSEEATEEVAEGGERECARDQPQDEQARGDLTAGKRVLLDREISRD